MLFVFCYLSYKIVIILKQLLTTTGRHEKIKLTNIQYSTIGYTHSL